jgi:D-amino peptidase
MEGVAGVLDFENWCYPDGRYFQIGREFLTLEANAAIGGFFDAGATEVMVIDGHGYGGINPKLLDSRAEFCKYFGAWPYGVDETFDAVAWVGQHPRSRTEFGHLSHTQWPNFLEIAVNGMPIGELGQFALCASELGVRAIFASGDLALTKEAQALLPGIETVAVKRGTTAGTGDDLPGKAYEKRNLGAIHLSPERARNLIAEGAFKAVKRAQNESFGLIDLKPPFERVTTFRPEELKPKRVSVETHPTSVIALLNTAYAAR